MRNILVVIAAMLAGLLTSVGCVGTYYPEKRLSLEELVARHNANAVKAPRLWARAHLRVSVTDADGRGFSWGSASTLGRSNGRLMLVKDGRRPPRFVIIGSEVATELFRLGIDADAGLYYFWCDPGRDARAWFGRTDYAGAPKAAEMPIDPTQIPEIIGVTELPVPGTDQMPAVVMTLRAGPQAYVVSYLKPQPVTGMLKVWREVYFRWDDKLPPRPFHVRLYDPDGMCRMYADLDAYAPVETDGPRESWPVMPTDIRVTWPEIAMRSVAGEVSYLQRRSELHMVLSDASTVQPFSRKVFSFWPHLPPAVGELKQVDSAYGPVGPESRQP